MLPKTEENRWQNIWNGGISW